MKLKNDKQRNGAAEKQMIGCRDVSAASILRNLSGGTSSQMFPGRVYRTYCPTILVLVNARHEDSHLRSSGKPWLLRVGC